MKNELNIPQDIKQEIVQYLSGRLSKAEAQRLWQWLKADEGHKDFFYSFSNVWHMTAIISHNPKFNENVAFSELTNMLQIESDTRLRKLVPFREFKIVVLLIILLATSIITFIYYGKTKVEPKMNYYTELSAPLGSRSFVILPDGSKVWLNSGTKVRYSNSFGIMSRDIEMQGEAYFLVSKNKKLPFVVKTTYLKIIALGTAFNVKAYEDEKTIETTLEEGSVKIETNELNQLLLKPKEKAVYVKDSDSIRALENKSFKKETRYTREKVEIQKAAIQVVSLVDTKANTSWKDRRWVFRHESLSDLAIKLERKYNVKIVFQDTSLKNYVFNGTLEDESVEQVFEAIRLIAPVNFRIDHNTIILSLNNHFNENYEELLSH